ncbi:hypothetical protein GCM10007323_15500 [Lactobacillus apis]|nr:hypothetical protein GCM10007323_15500 [Lactobacillus apis]
MSARLVYQYVICGLLTPISIVFRSGPLALVFVALAKTYPGKSGASGIVTVSPTLPVILTGFKGERLVILTVSLYAISTLFSSPSIYTVIVGLSVPTVVLLG